MNSAQAKKLSLPDILSRHGHEPVKTVKGGNELWYLSPFRSEIEPSFHTSFLGGQWIWKDFGDIGGTVIDFIMRYKNYYQVGDALKYLDQLFATNHSVKQYSKPQKTTKKEYSNQLQFIEAKEIQHPSIINYLKLERKIEESIFRKYLKEIHYKNLGNGKQYFAFGMLNQSNGYEIRVASDDYPFKSSLIKKDISLIKGFKPSHKVVNIFEGMSDFLSLLTLMKTDQLPGDAIIMHSLSSLQRTTDLIKAAEYQSIHTYLDNNRSGREHTEQLSQAFGNTLQNESELFLPHEDLNDFLKSNP